MGLSDEFDFIHFMHQQPVYHATRTSLHEYMVTWFSPTDNRHCSVGYAEDYIMAVLRDGTWLITSGIVEEDAYCDMQEVI